MTQALIFNEITLSPVTYQNSLWIRATELARALGYSDTRKITHLYERNADEFTPEMTQVIEIADVPEMGTLENLRRKARIFSLRGCHLVAMFARTPVAKAFRRWVLDVLDKLDAEQHAASSSPDDFTSPLSLTPSTTEDRKPLRALVGSWAQVSGLPFAACWNQLKAAFNLANIKELPQEWIPDALAWVQAKIDALPKALPLQPERLPLYRNGCFYPPHRDRSHVPGPHRRPRCWSCGRTGHGAKPASGKSSWPCCGNWTPAAATCSATPCPTWAAMRIPCSARSACWTACSRAARKPSNNSARHWMTPACTCA